MARLLSVSLPDELSDDTEALAREQGKTKSEVVRDALRQYVSMERFRELQTYGMQQAERLGIGPEDVEDLIDEVRAEDAATAARSA